jgi:short-subunit dehydrogenase
LPRLAARGYDLVLTGRDAAALASAAANLGGRVEILPADLTKPADLHRLANLIRNDPELELLVNNAGVVEPGDVADQPWETLARHIQINLTAPMQLTQAAAQGMKARRRGCILTIVSAAGLVGLPGYAAYSASKFGLRGFLISASQDLSASGVKIRAVLPGAVDTAMLRYEATHGGSVLNFLNKDVLSADTVALACVKAIDGRRLETHLPAGDGVLGRLFCAFPGLLPRVIPLLQRQGEQGLARYRQSRGLTAV